MLAEFSLGAGEQGAESSLHAPARPAIGYEAHRGAEVMRRLVAFGAPPALLMECEERADQEIDSLGALVCALGNVRHHDRISLRRCTRILAQRSSQRRQCGTIAALT